MTIEQTLSEGGSLDRVTPVLPAGRYTVRMSGTGDGDLHARVGMKPNSTYFDCRPYKTGSQKKLKQTQRS